MASGNRKPLKTPEQVSAFEERNGALRVLHETTHLYKRSCPSVCTSVRRFVRVIFEGEKYAY